MDRTSRNVFVVLAGLILSVAAFTAQAHHCKGAHANDPGCEPPPPPPGGTFDFYLNDQDPPTEDEITDPHPMTGTLEFNYVNDVAQPTLEVNLVEVSTNTPELNLKDTYDAICEAMVKDARVPELAYPERWAVGHTLEHDRVTVLFQGIVGEVDPGNPEDVYGVQLSGTYDRDCPFPQTEPAGEPCPNPILLTDWQIADRRKGNKRCRINGETGSIGVWLCTDQEGGTDCP